MNLGEDHPENNPRMKYWPLAKYIYGAAAGLIFLAGFSDFVFKPHMMFLPIFYATSFLLLFYLGCFFYSNVIETIEEPNEWIITVEGFIVAQAQFYYLFMTPLRIADKYRLTQEVTPAGTLISTVLCCVCLLSAYIGAIFNHIFLYNKASEPVKRLCPIILLIVTVIIIFKPSIKEARSGRAAARSVVWNTSPSRNLSITESA